MFHRKVSVKWRAESPVCSINSVLYRWSVVVHCRSRCTMFVYNSCPFVQLSMEEEERRRIRRERNKVAASKCRMKRKHQVRSLMKVNRLTKRQSPTVSYESKFSSNWKVIYLYWHNINFDWFKILLGNNDILVNMSIFYDIFLLPVLISTQKNYAFFFYDCHNADTIERRKICFIVLSYFGLKNQTSPVRVLLVVDWLGVCILLT